MGVDSTNAKCANLHGISGTTTFQVVDFADSTDCHNYNMIAAVNVDRKTGTPFSCVDQSTFQVSDSKDDAQLSVINESRENYRECTNAVKYTAPTTYSCSKSKGGAVLTCKDPSQCYSVVLTSTLSGSGTPLKDPSDFKTCPATTLPDFDPSSSTTKVVLSGVGVLGLGCSTLLSSLLVLFLVQ